METLVKTYYRLAKPGIIYGNSLSAIAGYFLASGGHVLWVRFVATIVGLGLIIGSACAYNNVLDRGIDRKMKRTSKRALVQGTISVRSALVYATVLGAAGTTVLLIYTNILTVLTALFGLVMYVGAYGYFKRRSVYGTEVGSISGAVPPVVGYVAVTGRLDLAALLLFVILVFWQMPHFYAIAIMGKKDYAAANIPVLPLKRGLRATKIRSTIYIILFLVAVLALTVFGYTNWVFAVVMALFSGWWLWRSAKPFAPAEEIAWARKLFKASLIVLLAFCVLVSLNSFIS